MLWGATKCRINEPGAPKNCQDVQYKRPCDNVKYRDEMALLKSGTIQPIPYYETGSLFYL